LKHLFLSVLLLICCGAAGQTVSAQEQADCATQLPANYRKWRNNVASVNNLVTTLKHDICVNKKFSIVFFVVAESNKTWGGVSPADLDSGVALLNRTFRRICVSFMNCSTVVIPNFEYNNWEMPDSEKMVTGNWHADSTINIYLPSVINGTPTGYAYMPGGKDVIVIEKTTIFSNTLLHEMGHFFGLPHTHDEIGGSATPAPPSGVGSNEFVDRTNCTAHGDGFCDTEADSYPMTGVKDGFNKYYVIPKDNIMSYHGNSRCRFTQEQYNFMALVMQGQRQYLH
jgi:hypothetical protein